jgi:hypothetical protein
MKINITGLLKLAKRHLEILDELHKTHPDIMQGVVEERFEVISAGMILDELIENIEIVKKDPSQLESFLTIYCIKEP